MIKKLISLFIITLCALTLVACDNGNNDIKPIINIDSEYDYVRVGEEMELLISSNLSDEFIWSVDDEDLATIDEFGYIKGLSEGEVIVTAQSVLNPEYTKSITLHVIDAAVNKITISGINYGCIGDTLTLKYTLFPKGITSDYSLTILDEGIATINKDKTITLKNYGVTKLIVKALDDLEYQAEYTIACCDFSKIYVNAELGNTKKIGDIVKYNNIEYYYGYTALNNLNDLNNRIIDNSIIEIDKGTYNDRLSIKASNVYIKGTNDTILKKPITLIEGVKDITIEALNFQSEGKIEFNGDNENILIQNNNFGHLATQDSFIYIKSNDKACNNITITNNTFDFNGIELNNINNIKITQNTFKGANNRAIVFDNPNPTESCQYLIKGNIFENCDVGIESSLMSSIIVSYDTIYSIFDNTFDGVNNAIYLNGNNNGTVSLDIRYNDFNNCFKHIFIDTLESNIEKLGLHASINYNNFTTTAGNKYDNIVDYYLRSNEEAINTIDATNNFFCMLGTPVDLNDSYKFSSNFNCTDRIMEKIQIKNTHKIYGKSSLYTDQETSLSCEFANAYTSSDESIVKVDNNGKLIPQKEGKATIKAYQGTTLINTFNLTVYGDLAVNYATELLRVAFTQEGYHEGANNLTKYGEWYGEQVHDKSFANGAWCAMFVTWCANQANIPTSIIPLYASCSAGRSWFESRGLFKYKESYKPKAGDIIFFLSNGASHTGIVISYDSKTGTVYTIEGNTSDMCAKRSYNWNNSRITGYGTPNYPEYNGKQVVEFDVSGATDGSGASTR